jgi:hypothetical protein
MSLSRQHLQHVLRSLLGGAAVYALLLQIMLAALAGAPAGLDVASALCASDHAISAEQPDQPSAPIHHDCMRKRCALCVWQRRLLMRNLIRAAKHARSGSPFLHAAHPCLLDRSSTQSRQIRGSFHV